MPHGVIWFAAQVVYASGLLGFAWGAATIGAHVYALHRPLPSIADALFDLSPMALAAACALVVIGFFSIVVSDFALRRLRALHTKPD